MLSVVIPDFWFASAAPSPPRYRSSFALVIQVPSRHSGADSILLTSRTKHPNQHNNLSANSQSILCDTWELGAVDLIYIADHSR